MSELCMRVVGFMVIVCWSSGAWVARAQDGAGAWSHCAQVGEKLGLSVRGAEMLSAHSQMTAAERAQYRGSEGRVVLLCELIEERLLADEARRRGLADKVAVRRLLDRTLAGVLLRQVLAQVDVRPVSEAQIEQYYKAHPSDFIRPTRVRVAMIVTDSERQAERIFKQALRLNERGFGKLAKKVSLDDYTRIRGGKTTWLYQDSKGDSDPELVEAAFRLTPAVSGRNPLRIVKGEDERFYVMRLLERQEAEEIPIERVQSSIRSRIQHERREAAKLKFLQNLAKRALSSNPPLADEDNRDKVHTLNSRQASGDNP